MWVPPKSLEAWLIQVRGVGVPGPGQTCGDSRSSKRGHILPGARPMCCVGVERLLALAGSFILDPSQHHSA